jgi:hypothetical protein
MVAQAEMTDTRNKQTAERLTKIGSYLVHWTIAAVLATIIGVGLVLVSFIAYKGCA